MGNENERPIMGLGASESAQTGIVPPDSGIKPPEDQAVLDDAFDFRLQEALGGVIERLDILTAAVGRLADNGVSSRAISPGGGGEGLETAREAEVFAAFCLSATKRGMSPDMVADAFRLADLSGISTDGGISEVKGVDEAVDALLLSRPYLFSIRPVNIGSETNPLTGPASYPEEVEGLARALGVSTRFAAELVKKRSDRVGGVQDLPGLWRMPRTGRLSVLDTDQ